MTTPIPTHTLNDGTALPQIGFGTYPLRGVEGVDAITSALQTGYRLIDSAVNYDNEREVGEALVRSEVPRPEVLVTTKVPGRFHEHHLAVQSVEDSLRRIGTDYLDLVLIHWPNPSVDQYVQAWQALVDVQERGLVRSIGVSNFTEAHLERVIERTGITPSVNQIELHPALTQEHLRSVHAERGIATEAWSPLAQGKVLDEQAVVDAAKAHDAEPGQVVLAWHLALGNIVFPKSVNPDRLASNFASTEVTLTQDEIDAISAIDRAERIGPDPSTFN